MMSCVGDWMGSVYDIGGRRLDYHLFLNHDGRFEREVHCGSSFELIDRGNWLENENEKLLSLESESLEELHMQQNQWRVLSVTSCEDSNAMLVLREAILGSRNLPIIFYRVHCNGRGYGENWENRLQACQEQAAHLQSKADPMDEQH